MDRWSEAEKGALSRLDREFHQRPDPLTALLEKHCRAHRSAFE